MAFKDGITSIVVSYNCLESLKLCLQSLTDQKGVDNEIVVIDNDSGDGTQEYLKKEGIKAILSTSNLGYGRAVNLAANEATMKYLFILNPDTEVPSGSLNALYRYARASEEIGLISPVLRHPDGAPQLSARHFPGRLDFLVGRGSPLFKLGLAREKTAGYIWPENENPLEVPAVSATAVLIERELFCRIGGFDERFFLYLEDLDLCLRIRESGLKIMLLPSVQITHRWRQSSRNRRYFALYHHHLSVWRYFAKHRPQERFLNTILILALTTGFLVSSLMTAMGLRGRE
jgi:GT2 family glycosyltransferase